MNMRILVLWLMLAAPLAWAQESPKPAKAKAAERAAMLETLQKGKEIKGGREQYRHLPGVLAVAHGANETPQEAIARVGAGGSQLLETKGRLVLFRSAQQKAASVEAVGGSAGDPVVLNTRTRTFWVLTRALVGEPKRLMGAAGLPENHRPWKSKEDAHPY